MYEVGLGPQDGNLATKPAPVYLSPPSRSEKEIWKTVSPVTKTGLRPATRLATHYRIALQRSALYISQESRNAKAIRRFQTLEVCADLQGLQPIHPSRDLEHHRRGGVSPIFGALRQTPRK